MLPSCFAYFVLCCLALIYCFVEPSKLSKRASLTTLLNNTTLHLHGGLTTLHCTCMKFDSTAFVITIIGICSACALLCLAWLSFALLCLAWLGFALLCFAWLRFAFFCLAWLVLALLCFALLCLAFLGFALFCFAYQTIQCFLSCGICLRCVVLACFALPCFGYACLASLALAWSALLSLHHSWSLCHNACFQARKPIKPYAVMGSSTTNYE